MASMTRSFLRKLGRENKTVATLTFKDGLIRQCVLETEIVKGKRSVKSPRVVRALDGTKHEIDFYNNDIVTGEKVYFKDTKAAK